MTKPKTKIPTKRYTNYYLILLIATTVLVILTLPALLETSKLITHYSVAPFYVTLELISSLSLFLTIAALILLYQKRRLGIILMLIDLALGMLNCIALAFGVDQTVAYTLATTSAANLADSQFVLTTKTFMPYLLYSITIIQGVAFFVAAILWRNAWNNQVTADKLPRLKI